MLVLLLVELAYERGVPFSVVLASVRSLREEVVTTRRIERTLTTDSVEGVVNCANHDENNVNWCELVE